MAAYDRKAGQIRARRTLGKIKFQAARAILGTFTLRDTVDRAFDEVIMREARVRSIAQLRDMDGLDLDKPAVMDKAWR